MIDRLLGEWYVVATTFPMWTSGRRTHPRFHYEPLPAVLHKVIAKATR